MLDWMVRARERKGLTQKELAQKTGVTRQAISSIERGNSFPRPDTARAIARTLDEDVSKFYIPQSNNTTPKHMSSV